MWYNIFMLKKGPTSIRSNMKELMTNIESEGRRKAIATLAKKHNISFADAQFRQAQAISLKKSREK